MSPIVPVCTSLEVRWRDLDALGHVNNAVYLTYFEQGRIAYTRALLGPDAELDRRTMLPVDFQFIVAEATCNYRSPAGLSDRLTIAIHVSSVGRKSFIFGYVIREQESDRLIAEGCTTQVWYDYAAQASQPVPEAMVSRMSALQKATIPRTATESS